MAMGYSAASQGPTWRIFVAWSSITWEAPSGGAFTSPSRTTQVPVALSSSMPCTSDRTMHCRLTGPVPSLSSRKQRAPLSATRPVLTQPPTTIFAPIKEAPRPGQSCTALMLTRSYSLL